MENDTVVSPSEAIRRFFETNSGALIFEYDDDQRYQAVVRQGLPNKLGMGSIDPDLLYDGLLTLIGQGFVREEFDTVKYRAGISETISQTRVVYRLR